MAHSHVLELPTRLVPLIVDRRWPTMDDEVRHNRQPVEPRLLGLTVRAPHEIDPTTSLVIGDCGLGPHAPIILDDRTAPPCVRRLSPRTGEPRVWSWDVIGADFDAFSKTLGLD